MLFLHLVSELPMRRCTYKIVRLQLRVGTMLIILLSSDVFLAQQLGVLCKKSSVSRVSLCSDIPLAVEGGVSCRVKW